MLVTFWTNIMDVQTEKNCALCSHMYENAEDLTYVCTICWEANSIVNSFFFFFFQNYLLHALQEAGVHIAKGS